MRAQFSCVPVQINGRCVVTWDVALTDMEGTQCVVNLVKKQVPVCARSAHKEVAQTQTFHETTSRQDDNVAGDTQELQLVGSAV